MKPYFLLSADYSTAEGILSDDNRQDITVATFTMRGVLVSHKNAEVVVTVAMPSDTAMAFARDLIDVATIIPTPSEQLHQDPQHTHQGAS